VSARSPRVLPGRPAVCRLDGDEPVRDTDVLLVQEDALGEALAALRGAGHDVRS